MFPQEHREAWLDIWKQNAFSKSVERVFSFGSGILRQPITLKKLVLIKEYLIIEDHYELII